MSRTSDSVRMIKLFTWTANNDVEFVGEATPGTATSAARWRIYKLTYDASFNPITKKWAGGESTQFTQVWDDRSGLVYS